MNYGAGRLHGVVQARKSGYGSALEGHRFALRNGAYTAGPTAILAQTSFVATTPTIMIRNNASKRNLVLSSFWMSLVTPEAGGPISVSIFRDTANRYSSGGTLLKAYSVDQPTRALGAGVPAFTSYANPTASAAVDPATTEVAGTAGVGTYPLYDFSFGSALSSDPIVPDIEDGIRISATGSILIYVWAATTAPTFVFGGEVIEETVEATS